MTLCRASGFGRDWAPRSPQDCHKLSGIPTGTAIAVADCRPQRPPGGQTSFAAWAEVSSTHWLELLTLFNWHDENPGFSWLRCGNEAWRCSRAAPLCNMKSCCSLNGPFSQFLLCLAFQLYYITTLKRLLEGKGEGLLPRRQILKNHSEANNWD